MKRFCNPCKLVRQRYVVAFMCFLSLMTLYQARILSQLIIGMVVEDPLPFFYSNGTDLDYCSIWAKNVSKEPKNLYENITEPSVIWSKSQWMIVTQAFSIGYLPILIPSGIFSDYYSARWILMGALIACGVSIVSLPITITQARWFSAAAMRLILGVTNGVAFPAITAVLSKWAPLEERSVLTAFTFSGTAVGVVIAYLLLKAATTLANNWKMASYIFGVCSLVTLTLDYVWFWPCPADCPYVQLGEKEYLEANIEPKKRVPIPIVKILFDEVVWSLILGHFGHTWIYFTHASVLPAFLHFILGLEGHQFVSIVLPFSMLIAVTILYAPLADYLYNKKKLTPRNVRRLSTAIGNILPPVFGLVTMYSGCNKILALVLSVFSVASMGPFYSGIRANVLDMTQHFAGTVCGVSSSLAASAYIITPHYVNYFASKHKMSEWRWIFWSTLFTSVILTSWYILLSRAGRRSWDYPGEIVEDQSSLSEESSVTSSKFELDVEKEVRGYQTLVKEPKQK